MKISIIIVLGCIFILFGILILGFQNKDETFTTNESESTSEETLETSINKETTSTINMDLGSNTTESEDIVGTPLQSSINTKCIVKTAVSSPLQSCSNISDNLISTIPNYNGLVNDIQPILEKIAADIAIARNKYSKIIDTTLKDYQNNENLIRQQKYFLLQNKNVSAVSDAYGNDLINKTDKEKEKLNIELNSYDTLKSSESDNAAILSTYSKYTRILIFIMAIVILGNVLMAEI
jgi:hypothetical protein